MNFVFSSQFLEIVPLYKGAINCSEQLTLPIYTLNKGAIDFSEHNRNVRPKMDFKNFNHLSLEVKK